MSWEITHFRLFQSSESVMKAMCGHQNLDGLTKHFPKKIHKEPFTICYTIKAITINKGKTVNTSNFQPGELFNMDFVFYNVPYIRAFIFMLTVVCEKDWNAMGIPNCIQKSTCTHHLLHPDNTDELITPMQMCNSCLRQCLGKFNRCHKMN